MSMHSPRKYRVQFERMMRWYHRFEERDSIAFMKLPSQFNEVDFFLHALDDILAFFLNCYSLKDWIKNDETIDQEVRDNVEKYINEAECMRICADICNGSKHLKRNQGQLREKGFLDFTASFGVSTNEGPIEIAVNGFGLMDTDKVNDLNYRRFIDSLSAKDSSRDKVIQVRAFAETESGSSDAFYVAMDCVEFWTLFVEGFIEK